MTPLARLTTILARTPGVPDSTPLTMGGEVELQLTLGDLRWLVEECSASAARLGAKPPPEGFQLVPVEPTKAMVAACLCAVSEWRKTLTPDEAILRRSEPTQNGRVFLASATPEEKAALRWKAMLSAAKETPQ